MTEEYFLTEHYQWTSRILSTLLELLMIVLFFYHSCKYYKFQKSHVVHKSCSNIVDQKWKQFSHIFTIITLFCYIIMGGNYTLNMWSVWNYLSCDAIEIFSVWCYHLCKFWLYIVLLMRITSVFYESMFYAKIRKHTFVLSIILSTYLLYASIGTPLLIRGYKVYTNKSKNMFYCHLADVPVYGWMSTVIYDMTISIWCCVLFIWPLTDLLKRTDLENAQRKYAALIKKYSILTATAIVSTMVIISINSLIPTGWIVLLDNLINAICIVLMSTWYNKLFSIICCCCHSTDKGIGRVHRKSQETITSTVDKSMISTDRSSVSMTDDKDKNKKKYNHLVTVNEERAEMVDSDEESNEQTALQ